MTDTRRKGTKHEREAMELYESWGYKTWKPAKSSRRIGDTWVSQSQDICNLFDFLAYNEHNLHFVQVKSDESDASKARKAIDGAGLPIWSVNLVVMARLPRKPGKFIIWHYDPFTERWKREHSDNWS